MLEICATFFKTIFMNICIALVLTKIKNYNLTNKKSVKIIIGNILISIIYSIIYNEFGNELSSFNIIVYLIYSFIVIMIFKEKFYNSCIIIIISISISYMAFVIATGIIYILEYVIEKNNVLNMTAIDYIVIGCLQIILIFIFFKIKRFKNGFSFLKEMEKSRFYIFGVVISLIIITTCVCFVFYEGDLQGSILFGIGAILGLTLFKWIKSSITKFYKQKMKDRTVELQAEEILEKDEEIKSLKEELNKVHEINHKYNHRLSAMEKVVTKLGESVNFNEEFGHEYADVLSSLKELASEYKTELGDVNISKSLPKTDLFSIDNLLNHMRDEANKDNIEFKLEIIGNINYMVESIISKGKLETLIGDHVKDAIIAINFSNNKNKKILAKLGELDDCYFLSIYDTGIEFEIDTLLKFGQEQVTTHKDTGGSGMGFVTTFKTLKECRASLIIEEFRTNPDNFTKCVTIKFDGKNEYKILSYRAKNIKEKNSRKDITIENIE